MTHRRWQTVSWRAKTISLTCRRSLWAAVFCLAACYVMSGSAYASAAASDLSGHPAMTLPPPPPPEYDTPELLWSYSTGNTIESTPVVVDGILYVGSVDHHLYALDAASGELLWRYQSGAVGISVPTVADGVVYVGTVEGDLYAPQSAAAVRGAEFDTTARAREEGGDDFPGNPVAIRDGWLSDVFLDQG